MISYYKDISWFLLIATIGLVVTGYTLTFLDSDNALLRTYHFISVISFTPSFILHVYISTVVRGVNWVESIKALFRHNSPYLTLRVIQRLSGLFLLVFGGLQIISGLDWFKLGLNALLPYLVHRENDLYVMIFLSVHVSTGLRFWMIRRRSQVKVSEQEKISLERRESLITLGGAILGIVGALLLNNPTQVGTGNRVPNGVLPPGQTEIE